MNNRVTLYMMDEDLIAMDTIIRSSPTLKNRSDFMRTACVEYIKTLTRGRLETAEDIVLKLPDGLLKTIDYMVLNRYCDTREAACERLIAQGLEAIGRKKIREEVEAMKDMDKDVQQKRKRNMEFVEKYSRV